MNYLKNCATLKDLCITVPPVGGDKLYEIGDISYFLYILSAMKFSMEFTQMF